MLDINVTGTFLIAQAAAREMLRMDTTGSMVFVASMSGYVSNKVRTISSPVVRDSGLTWYLGIGRRYSRIQRLQGGRSSTHALSGCRVGIEGWNAFD